MALDGALPLVHAVRLRLQQQQQARVLQVAGQEEQQVRAGGEGGQREALVGRIHLEDARHFYSHAGPPLAAPYGLVLVPRLFQHRLQLLQKADEGPGVDLATGMGIGMPGNS